MIESDREQEGTTLAKMASISYAKNAEELHSPKLINLYDAYLRLSTREDKENTLPERVMKDSDLKGVLKRLNDYRTLRAWEGFFS